MTTFVMVHGAWHGGWAWDRLRPLLEARGHLVFTPTLTGLGERANEGTPDTGLETHVNDLVQLVDDNDLVGAVVVAHSYAGIPVTALADRRAARIAAVIYLDSGMPQDGQSSNDVWPAGCGITSSSAHHRRRIESTRELTVSGC